LIEYRTGSDLPLPQVRALYRAVRWLHWLRPRILKQALINSDLVVSAWEDKHLIGLLRVISDGCFNAYIADILVHPDHHRRGVARGMVSVAVRRFRGLYNITAVTEDPVGEKFFKSCGFHERRVALRLMRPIRNVVRTRIREGRRR